MRRSNFIGITGKLILLALTLSVGAGCTVATEESDEFEPGEEEIGTVQDEVTGPGSSVSYERALVRLDLSPSGRCSSVLAGPNLLVTAAHCVAGKTIDGVSSWNGMKYGKIRVRMVYKPSSTETMCLNETCRDASGATRYSTVYAFWAGTYSGTGDWSSDIAVITRIGKGDFPTKATDPGDPAPRSLNSNDFRRVLNVSLPTSGAGWEMRVAGYGAPSDGSSTLNPRAGFMHVDDWNTHTLEAQYNSGAFWSAFCKGDSGGPLTYTAGIGGRTYLGGVTVGFNDSISGSCPEVGDDLAFNRVSSKVWMLDRVRNWVENQTCTLYSSSSLPGSGQYYKCW